jgi:hypothetical protein
VLIGPSTGASRRPLGQGFEAVSQNLLGLEGAEGGAHLLCWGEDGLGGEGLDGSRDAADDKAAVDAGGCAVVFRTIGGGWQGARFGKFVLEGVGVLQALQTPSCVAGTPVGTSV